jgi:hypothetical protein
MTVIDHRPLNWRFVVPSEPNGLLLLAAADEAGEVPGAVVCDPGRAALLGRTGPYPAVVVADLGRWSQTRAGRRGGRGRGREARELLAEAAAAVAPGGWLYASFANPWYPLRSGGGGLTLAAAATVLRGAGLQPTSTWLVFPDQRTAAYLVPAGGGPELAYFMRTFFFPYATDGSARKARIKQRALTLMRRVSLVAPARLRSRFAPAFAVVAERPA